MTESDEDNWYELIGPGPHMRPFDPAEYLDTPESQLEYLLCACESRDLERIVDALDVIDRARQRVSP